MSKTRGFFVGFMVFMCIVIVSLLIVIGIMLNERGIISLPVLGATSPPDLFGEWQQVDGNSLDTYHVATIQGDIIEIYWIMEDGDTKALYWAGSFSAPIAAGKSYSWESENDTEKTGTALMASSDASKIFTYKDGILEYEASAMGITQTVQLRKA